MKNLLFILFTTLFLNTQAQSTAKIPDDINIKTGTFSNGLKYYIKNNKLPEDKLELRLVVNIGSIVEDDDQQGLAHFMEHMCFNGTKNFEKNELVNYLESIGVKFGAHLNASTGFDKTVYKLSIPTDKKVEVEKAFQILEDWAFNVTLSDEEIEKERGVVIEEYRAKLGANKRLFEKYLPKLLYKSKYADRLPIGKKEIIENFDPAVLRRFYKDWYRPDLMAIIAVGDISVEELEAKIIAHFDKPNKAKNPRERKYFSDENHQETFIEIVADEELTSNNVDIIYKNPELKQIDNSTISYKEKLKERLFNTMINARFQELSSSYEPPFIYGYSNNSGGLIKNTENYISSAKVKDENYVQALKVLIEENERVKRYGFLESELKRAKINMLAGIDKSFKDEDKLRSNQFIKKIIRNFTDGNAISSLSWKHEFYHKVLPEITIEEVNALINGYIREDNRLVLISGKEKRITEKEVMDLFETVKNDTSLKAYKEIEIRASLFTEKPQKGEILTESANKKLDIYSFTLSNGARIHFKKTDFKEDQVLFRCASKGGRHILNDEDFFKTNRAIGGLTQAGIAGLTNQELKKITTGKIASVKPYIANHVEGMYGSSSNKDLETLFQLINLNFTSLNKDDKAFEAYREKMKSIVANALANPVTYFNDEIDKFQYANYKRNVSYAKPVDFDSTDYDLAYKIYQERFGNAADFDFVFVGNFDEEKLKEYAKIYLASLPASEKREDIPNIKVNVLEGDNEKVIYKGSEEKSVVKIIYAGNIEFNKKEAFAFATLKDILKIKLIEKLREEESDVYTPGVSAKFDRYYNWYEFKISFYCAPENVDKLIALSKQEVTKLITDGPSKIDLDKIKEADLLTAKQAKEYNSYWLSGISNAILTGDDVNEIFKTEKKIKQLNTKELKNVAKKFLDIGVFIGVLFPEEK